MDLYRLRGKTLTKLSENPFSLEKNIQTLVEENISQIFGYSLVSSEFSIAGFRIDTLCFNKKTNSFVIIEYKKGKSYSVIDQGRSYLHTMLNNKADFILEYQEKHAQGTSALKKSEVDWGSSKVVFISPSFNAYQKNSINFKKDVEFELWEIRRFGGKFIALERHHPGSKENIKTIPGNSPVQPVSKEITSYKEEGLLSASGLNTKNLWQELKGKLAQLRNIEFVPQSKHVNYTKNGTTVCSFHFRKNRIRVKISKGSVYPDGRKYQNFFVIDDPKNVCKAFNFTLKSGKEVHRYEFIINKSAELDYVEMLIKQKYKSI